MSDSLWPRELQHARLPCSYTISQSLLQPLSMESMMPSNQLILCCPLLLLPSIFPSIRIFPSKLAVHIRWPTYWSFSISHFNEYSGLISFRIDWFDILAVQGTLKSLIHTTVQKHQFFSTWFSLWSNSHIHNMLAKMWLKWWTKKSKLGKVAGGKGASRFQAS